MAVEVRWERLFRDQIEARFAKTPVLYLTYGLCEPHGPHNALGLDALKAHAIAVRAAQAHGGIVAPPDYWHIHELGLWAAWSHQEIGEVRPWLTSVPPWHHFKSVCYQIRAADALGFKAIVLLTGHYGPNYEDLTTLVELLQPSVGARMYGLPDFEANQPGFDGATGDHAGKVETSLLWALEPECVDMARLAQADLPAERFATGATAADSDQAVGERMVADEVRWLGVKAQELLDAYDREQPTARLATFAQVEQIWDEVVRPRLADFKSMAPGVPGYEREPDDSQWRANAAVPSTFP